MESKEDSSLFCFCVFHHQPFQRGIEGVEEASIIDQLIYKYPSSLSDRSVEDFISAIISLYTYTTLTLQERNLDFLAWSKSKVAIRTIKNQEDKSILFFVLRLPEQYSNSSIIKTIDYLKNGIFFAIGPEKILLIPELDVYKRQAGYLIYLKESPLRIIFSTSAFSSNTCVVKNSFEKRDDGIVISDFRNNVNS